MGHRVVVRRRVGVGPTGRDVLTDLLGTLTAVDSDRLVVRTDSGAEQTVPVTEVVAGKRIPPRPARFSELDALERLADRCWPAPVHERLGDWFLRAADGWTNRANSALPLGEPGRPIGAAVDAVAGWYRDRGLTPRITVPLPLRRDVAAALVERGWIAQPEVLVQTADLSALAEIPDPAVPEAAPAGPTGPARAPADRLELHGAPSPQFQAIVAARKLSLSPAALEVLGGGGAVRFAEVRAADGELLAIARGAFDPGRVGNATGWLHLGVVEVVESARRRGLAGRVTRALAGWGRRAGATRALLQVEHDNGPAIELYRRLGFATHHTYVTYRHPG